MALIIHGYRRLPRAVRWAIPALILLVIGVIASNRNSSSVRTDGTSATVTTAAASTIPKPEQDARSYIVAHGGDAYRVKATVNDVIDYVNALKASPAANEIQAQANLDRLATLAQKSRDYLDTIRADFAGSYGTDKLGNAELNVFSGANSFKNAMGALVTMAGNPNATNVANFNTQFAEATSEWNTGVRTIWQTAHRSSPPLT